ncbi:MAG: hypothetical protein ACRBG0_27785 [Lewinella sp.]|uniref:hypothetical protein n=1 Tax=Lewinella sp. TaxID=2004506 RepID=UPI003D6A2004
MEKSTAKPKEEQVEIPEEVNKKEPQKAKSKKVSNVLILGGKKKVMLQVTKERFVYMKIQDELNLPRELRIMLQVTNHTGTHAEVTVHYEADASNMREDIERIKKVLEN